MKAKHPLAESIGNSASEGSTTNVRSSEEGSLNTPTAIAQTIPFIGIEPVFSRAAAVALIRVAIRLAFHPRPTLPVPPPVSLPHNACPTICTSVLGCRESSKTGVKIALSAFDIDLESVPGNEASGRINTSRVACEGFSEAGRTSIGPETDTMHSVNPIEKHL